MYLHHCQVLEEGSLTCGSLWAVYFLFKGRGCHTLLKPYETDCGLWIWAIQIKFDWLIDCLTWDTSRFLRNLLLLPPKFACWDPETLKSEFKPWCLLTPLQSSNQQCPQQKSKRCVSAMLLQFGVCIHDTGSYFTCSLTCSDVAVLALSRHWQLGPLTLALAKFLRGFTMWRMILLPSAGTAARSLAL